MFKIDSLQQAKDIFEEQMKRLDVDYVDFYLLHALNKDTWKKVLDLNIIPYCEELRNKEELKTLVFLSMMIMKSLKKLLIIVIGISVKYN